MGERKVISDLEEQALNKEERQCEGMMVVRGKGRMFEITITEIKVEYQTVFGMRIWNKFLETKTIETSTSGIHLGMEPSLD